MMHFIRSSDCSVSGNETFIAENAWLICAHALCVPFMPGYCIVENQPSIIYWKWSSRHFP